MNRSRGQLLPPIIVNTPDAVEEMLYRLMAARAVAVDTESNSLYAYTERVCLIQFSVPGEDYLVDPLAVEDLSSLAPLLSDPDIVKTFHAAEYDVMVLRRDYGYTFANLFDTMVASRIVGWKRYGLASLLEEHFGIETNKRMQRTNWGRRPLSEEQLYYAQLDTHFLLSLRDRLQAELEDQGRVWEARLAFERVTESEWTKKEFDPDGFWQIKGARDLDRQQLAILREVYRYREDRAQALDRPPFKVLGARAMVALAQRAPQSIAELGRIKGVPRRLSSRERRKLLAVIEQGIHAPPPSRPRRTDGQRPDEATIDRYEALRDWRRERAGARGVEPDVILSNHILHTLARVNPTSLDRLDDIDALNKWERERYGREIITLLRRQTHLNPG
jgi:ribonuclease D